MSRFILENDDLDTTIELAETPTLARDCGESFLSFPRIDSLMWCIPVGRTTEAMIAECIGQSLTSGLGELNSLLLASRVFRRRRVGICLGEAAFAVESGQSMYAALKGTNPRVSANLLEAIRVGEARGQLEAELRSVARLLSPQVGQQLARWTGRSKQAIQFAGALSRLLNDHRFDATVVEDAGRLAASGNKRFLAVVASLVKGTEDGDSLAQSLHRFPKDFDPMFIRFVDVPSSRAAFRNNLNMLAGNQSD